MSDATDDELLGEISLRDFEWALLVEGTKAKSKESNEDLLRQYSFSVLRLKLIKRERSKKQERLISLSVSFNPFD